jgi:hypothetical protein
MVHTTDMDSDSDDGEHADTVSIDTVVDTESNVIPTQPLVHDSTQPLVHDSTQPLVHDYDTLEHLFKSVHTPLINPSETCEAIKPYVIRAMLKYPDSNVLKEVNAFIDEGIESSSKLHGDTSTWVCTTSQIHAIVGILNGNQILIEDDPTTTADVAAATTTQSDHDFMEELAAFAL